MVCSPGRKTYDEHSKLYVPLAIDYIRLASPNQRKKYKPFIFTGMIEIDDFRDRRKHLHRRHKNKKKLKIHHDEINSDLRIYRYGWQVCFQLIKAAFIFRRPRPVHPIRRRTATVRWIQSQTRALRSSCSAAGWASLGTGSGGLPCPALRKGALRAESLLSSV